MEDPLGGFPAARIFLVKLVLDVGSYILVLLVFVHSFQTNLNSAFFVTAGHVTLNNLYRVRLQQVCSRQRLFPLFLLLNISHCLHKAKLTASEQGSKGSRSRLDRRNAETKQQQYFAKDRCGGVV